MRRILAVSALALLVLSGCGKKHDAVAYMSAPFECRARLSIGSSEYVLKIEKGGADLVSVTVLSPEALEGLEVSLGGGSEVVFRGRSCAVGMPRTVAELIYAAFDTRNVVSSGPDGRETVVVFDSPSGGGKLRFDTFSSVPLSLEADGLYMDFTFFKR